MTKDEALKMAIEALDDLELCDYKTAHKAINACKEALEQPAQEPMCWWNETMGFDGFVFNRDDTLTPLYTHPHQWQGLTDDEIEEIIGEPIESMYSGHYNGYRAIEQALKEKNSV